VIDLAGAAAPTSLVNSARALGAVAVDGFGCCARRCSSCADAHRHDDARAVMGEILGPEPDPRVPLSVVHLMSSGSHAIVTAETAQVRDIPARVRIAPNGLPRVR
jgi:hypothetical protein